MDLAQASSSDSPCAEQPLALILTSPIVLAPIFSQQIRSREGKLQSSKSFNELCMTKWVTSARTAWKNSSISTVSGLAREKDLQV